MRRAIANVFLTMLVAACAGAAPEAQPDDEEAPVQESSVAVRLVDFVVEPTPDSVPTGRVTFSLTNDGYATDEKGDHIPSISAGRHELSVLRTDLRAGELPENTVEFVVEVEAPGIEVIGSTPVLEEGTTESLTLELEPGP
jgi:hypothetical protein